MGETTGGVLRRGSDRIIGGVCSGLGAYFHVEPLLVRIVFVVLALANGIGILLYLVLWLLMDPPVGGPVPSRNLGERIRSMGDELREDFRTGFFSSQGSSPAQRPTPSTTPGSGGPGSTPPHYQRPRGLWFGAILIVIGLYILLQNTGVLNAFRWDVWFWPAVLIALGVIILIRRR
jgi:phage shock protein C